MIYISIYTNVSIIKRLQLIDKLDNSSSSVTREDLDEIALSISDFINKNGVHPIERASRGLLEESFDFTKIKEFLVNPIKSTYDWFIFAYDFNSVTNNNLEVSEVMEMIFYKFPSEFRKHLVLAFFEGNKMEIFEYLKNVDLKNKKEIRLNYELVMFNFNEETKKLITINDFFYYLIICKENKNA